MSRYIQFIRPKCSVCYKRDHSAYRWRHGEITWLNVDFAGVAGEAIRLKCLNCGHTWKTYSKGARRAFRYLEKQAREA